MSTSMSSNTLPLSPARGRRAGKPRAKLCPYEALKSASDRAAAAVLLVAAIPALSAMAVLVKLTSPGPVFYSQVRLGRHGRAYRVYKVRTMSHDCEAATGPVWAAQDDPRVTPIGRFLRDTHLDELPQLWNVLRGEMSLIGPRPERPEIAAQLERVVPSYRRRLEARPGLTGLAQLRLPSDSDVSGVRRKLDYDLYYVRRVSPSLDLRIAASTLFYLTARVSKATSELLIRTPGRHAEREQQPADDVRPPELHFPRINPRRNDADTIDGVKAA
jgi:lipopolysaccharide/colanic/teichoic acid biosynthesis glycosyltransferase